MGLDQAKVGVGLNRTNIVEPAGLGVINDDVNSRCIKYGSIRIRLDLAEKTSRDENPLQVKQYVSQWFIVKLLTLSRIALSPKTSDEAWDARRVRRRS